jgi:hypothetical protein
MGAWGELAFDNDSACDWAGDLDAVDDLSLVEAAFDDLQGIGGEYLDQDLACNALAACEVVARLRGNFGYRNAYTAHVDEWVAAHPIKPPPELVARALGAIDRVLDKDSELRALWDESDEASAWHEAVKDLRRRIGRRVCPAPARPKGAVRRGRGTKKQYAEGTWFVVPLRHGGMALGLVARAKQGILLGYFFGPRRRKKPTLRGLKRLTARDAVLVERLGDAKLIFGKWPIIGRSPDWAREAWPMVPFLHHDALLDGVVWKREYADDDPGLFIRETRLRPPIPDWPRDGFAGMDVPALELDALLPRFRRQPPGRRIGGAIHRREQRSQ